MMPPTTTGVTCRRAAFGSVKIHFGPRRGHVGLGDLGQRGVAVAAGVAVVARPIGARRDLAKFVARAPQQVDAVVVGAQLQVVEALVQHFSVQGLPVGGHDFLTHHRPPKIARLHSAQEPGERFHLGIADLARGHSLPRQSVANQSRPTVDRCVPPGGRESPDPVPRRCRRRRGIVRTGPQRRRDPGRHPAPQALRQELP